MLNSCGIFAGGQKHLIIILNGYGKLLSKMNDNSAPMWKNYAESFQQLENNMFCGDSGEVYLSLVSGTLLCMAVNAKVQTCQTVF